MALLQAVPLRGVRHLPRPGRLYAVASGHADDQHHSRDQLRVARRQARDEGGALPQLADQPASKCGGHGIDQPRPGRHGKPELSSRTIGQERSLPEKLFAEAPAPHSRGAAGTAPAARLDARERRLSHQKGKPVSTSPKPQRVALMPEPQNRNRVKTTPAMADGIANRILSAASAVAP